jgi:hypothetical protein
MAHSPETHTAFNGGELRHPSIDSMVEISLPFLEKDVDELSAKQDIQLALRFADLHIFNQLTPTILAPKVDKKDAHPVLFAGPYTGLGLNGYHDVRRVIITYENQQQEVTSRDWLVDLTLGSCWSFESHRARTEEPTAANGPLIDINGPERSVTLSEGAEYQADLEALMVTLASEETDEFLDFMADTHPFIDGRISHLDMRDPNAFTHVRYP